LTDESYIKLALEIAKKGMGSVSPNPMVGCIVVKDSRIIGAGYHQRYGHSHAEVNAINNSSENVEGATLYINLEPCSHVGKTRPCVDKIIEKKIKKVIIGTLDMNPLVSGKGVQKLIDNGIEVKVGVLANECVDLNRFFFKYITKKIPYITLKSAQTLDGKIADIHHHSKWISSGAARSYVHYLRSKYDAVLIGAGTVERDNPRLTVRLTEGRNPKRIVLDPMLCLSTSHKIFHSEKNVFVLALKESIKKVRKKNLLEKLGVKIIFVDKNAEKGINLELALKELAKNNIASILVEGGSKTFTSFIKENMFDEIRIFISPKLIGKGLPVIGELGINDIRKAIKLHINGMDKIGDDVVLDIRR
jgi:diaminohydroxyphosphoribosylaminopyrimidine deaminase/5-amino-6-(5-phosphoribosylamino)uracil reductase